jgi:putative peptidoglycan lipid II flippase
MSARDGVGTLQLSAHQVRTWRTRSVNRRIFSAMLSVGGVVLVVKVAALAKDVVTASYFGTSDAMDAFLIAFVLPTFAINVIAGSLEAAVVPVYVGVRDADGPEAAKQLLSSVLVTSTALLVAMGVVLLIIGPLLLPALGATFVGEKLAMTRRLFFMLIPLVVVSGSGIVLSSALNANERFLWPAATPIISSALMLALLFAKGPQWGIYALVIGLIGGRVVEGLVLVWRLRAMDLLDWKAWRIRHPAVGQVLRSFLPVAAGAAVMSNSPLVDQAMASMLGSGSVAGLMYGGKLVGAGLSVAAPAVATVIFPHFAKMVAAEDWTAVRHTLRTYGGLILGAGTIVALLIIVFSAPLVRLLFERGAFSPDDTRLVARVQNLFALQIPFYLLSMVGVRLLTAMRGTKVVMWVSFCTFVVNVVANLLCMRLWGLPGIALSTSLVYGLSMVLVLWAVFRRLNALDRRASSTMEAS